jgi:nitrogen-specific signal transduction histidine kinase
MNLPQLAHDLRSPIARARTMAHLMKDATPEELEEYRQMLIESLEDIERLIKVLDRAPSDYRP